MNTSHAVGAPPTRALPAAAAVACLYVSIIHLDDMLDADPGALFHRLGMPATANLAAGLQALGLRALAHAPLPARRKLLALQSLNHMALVTAFGQHLDVHEVSGEVGYWRIVRLKSAPFFGAALHAGAVLGNAPLATAQKLRRLGHLYGEIVQIHDDLKDAMSVPAAPDWQDNRPSLPILFAQTVAHPEREQFAILRRAATDQEALIQAQRILVRCGALSYCVHQLLERHHRLRQLLRATPLAHPEILQDLIDNVVAPVQALMDTSTRHDHLGTP